MCGHKDSGYTACPGRAFYRGYVMQHSNYGNQVKRMEFQSNMFSKVSFRIVLRSHPSHRNRPGTGKYTGLSATGRKAHAA